jgi:hypothetical protein
MDIKEAYQVLRERYCGHSGAAQALGFGRRTYAGYRSGEYPIPESRSRHILLLAERARAELKKPQRGNC